MTTNTLEERMLVSKGYDHARWEANRRFLHFLLRKIGLNLLAKIERVEGLENIPSEGPGIIMINHIAFIDSVVTMTLMPRFVVPLAKIEVYDYPVVGIFPRLWGVIPVRREEVDRHAIRQALEVLDAGEMILMAPEGTRHPQLHQAKEGIAYIASRSGAPIVPVAISGTLGFPALRYTPRWRQPGAVVRFGCPFHFRADLSRPGRELLRQMTDEAMYILSAMLPESCRGFYSELSRATQETIEWVHPPIT